MEYRLNDGTRVDCLTDTLAVEVDFAPKWAECIGQCKHYSHKTGKQAACVLIIEDPKKDLKHLKKLRYNAYKPDMRFKTFTITPDKINKLTIQELVIE